MNYDWFANELADEADKRSFTDCYARIKHLARKQGDEASKTDHRELVHGKFKLQRGEISINPVYPKLINKNNGIMLALSIAPSASSLSLLPPHSFFLQLEFTLARPYLSKDDEAFHICDNPVRKDKVFKIPMVEGSSWKGNLRWAAVKALVDQINQETIDASNAVKERLKLIRLFGAEKGGVKKDSFEAYLDCVFIDNHGDEEWKTTIEEFRRSAQKMHYLNADGFGKGRLHFYPTFFDNIGLEVINPHDRRTKAGTVPVYIESAPEGAKGVFSLLYLAPFGEKAQTEAEEDYALICKALSSLLLDYGLSAKRSSGYGVIKKSVVVQSFVKKTADKDDEIKTYPDTISLDIKNLCGIYDHSEWPTPPEQVERRNNKKVVKDFKALGALKPGKA